MHGQGPDTSPAGTGTLEEHGDAASSRLAPPKPYLFIVLEADRPAAGGARYALEGIDEVVLGRGSARSCTREVVEGRRRLVVRVPGGRMSSQHARVVLEAEGWVVVDAGSKNGTLVAAARVDRRRLGDADLIEAGRTFFSVQAALPTPPRWGGDRETGSAPEGGAVDTLYPEEAARLDALIGIARSNLPILLTGESGVGKEVLARAIHARSQRSGTFVAVNCGALPGGIVEGLLFGHTRGAFSGAVRDEPGLVRAAEGGTLFLDEIGDLPVPAQASLLRVLQEREVLAVGATRGVRVDFRVISATHRDLDAMVSRGLFREDLLARLRGFRHAIPPLRQRRCDLGLLVAALLPRLTGASGRAMCFSLPAARALTEHDWPGNVRELEHALARALALSPEGRIGLSALALSSSLARPSSGFAEPGDDIDVRIRERLVAELARHEGNVSEVARAMGKARMQVQRWMRRFGLDAQAYRKQASRR